MIAMMRMGFSYKPMDRISFIQMMHLVFSYLSTFTTWHEYQHKVLSYVNGEYVPFPVNLCTLSQIFHEPFTKEKAQQYFQKVQQDPQSCKTFEDIAIASVGADLYEMFL